MKKYVFRAYSELFPKLFQKEKERIGSYIKEAIIEHVGSTAVPGLGGKGIIDIAIAVERTKIDSGSKELQDLGYEYKPVGSTPERLYFRIDLPDSEEGIRRYHVHLTFPESKEWKELIAFRDYLRTHPEDAKLYGELKKQAAEGVNEDGEKYRALKQPLFDKILKMIREEN